MRAWKPGSNDVETAVEAAPFEAVTNSQQSGQINGMGSTLESHRVRSTGVACGEPICVRVRMGSRRLRGRIASSCSAARWMVHAVMSRSLRSAIGKVLANRQRNSWENSSVPARQSEGREKVTTL